MVNACFQQKSTAIKCTIFLLVVLIIILTALFIVLMIKKEDHLCHSEQCVKASAEIMRRIQQSTNPCDDFYTFTCGNYMKYRQEHSLPTVDEEINSMISEMIKFNEDKPFAMQQSFYQACVNLRAIDDDQEETILDIFYSFGEWPVLRGSTWNGTFFDWTEIAKKSRGLGLKFNWFFEFEVYQDVNDTEMNILKIDIPKTLKTLTTREISLRKQLFSEIVEFMGAPKYAHYEISETINFEDELGRKAEKYRNIGKEINTSSLVKMRINELQSIWPSIGWLELINNITGNRMSGSDFIIFDIFDYLKDLNILILATPKRHVANYLMIKIIEEIWPFLSTSIRNTFEEYNFKIYNQSLEPNRYKFCINESKKQFPLVADSVFIRHHVTRQKRQLVRELLFLIRQEFTRTLRHASWMNRESRKRASVKLEKVQFIIGGPAEIFDQYKFAEILGVDGFTFKSHNIINMITERKLQFYERYYGEVNRRVVFNTVSYYEKIVNLTNFSLINQNTMVIPAAILRDAVFNPNLPNYLNYASLGRILAREIFNYVFENNRTIDDYYDNSRWTFDDIFDNPIKCLAKESSHLYSHEFRRPEKISENFAEFVAVDIAYEAYKEWVRNLPQEFMLPGLNNFTQNQLFWIQTSKFSCAKIHTKHDRDNSRFKIIGPLRNSPNFVRDYKCPEGSKMNSRRKCRVL